jgi:putative sigma-54 modulation protein
VTVFANGTVIRAQERSENLYASIDLVANKLARQLRKYKERHNSHNVHNNQSTKSVQNEETQNYSSSDHSLIEGKEPHLPSPGVRRKYFEMDPMTIEQARVQLDLIDHDFYLFREEKGSALRVIYKRNHGGYGVIQEKI